MKKLLLILLCVPLLLSSQEKIYTKDNVFMGYKIDLVESCINGANDVLNIGGNSVAIKDYCSCVTTSLMPYLYSWEIEDALKKNTMKELFLKDENIGYILECIDQILESDVLDGFNYGDQDYSDYDKSLMIKVCAEAMLEEGEGELLGWTYKDSYNYCSCAINTFVDLGYSLGQLKLIEDESSEAFNEVAIPCMQEIFSNSENTITYTNSYNTNDIIGSKESSSIELVDYFNSIYKIKIEIGGIIQYFTFDTGATDLVINTDLAIELFKKGIIKEEDFLGEEIYTLADNSVVIADMVKLDGLTIGDYTVNNVIIAVIEDGSLLCGIGLLSKFRDWELNQDPIRLTLYR